MNGNNVMLWSKYKNESVFKKKYKIKGIDNIKYGGYILSILRLKKESPDSLSLNE